MFQQDSHRFGTILDETLESIVHNLQGVGLHERPSVIIVNACSQCIALFHSLKQRFHNSVEEAQECGAKRVLFNMHLLQVHSHCE